MNIRFNNGYGAILCDKCSIIIHENLSNKEWDILNIWNKQNKKWYCEECDKEQYHLMKDLYFKKLNQLTYSLF